ncbi:unnamed protein product [Prunus armeniaca]|uniref:pectinesterase n=1 Tax=Prunus armeniaca TaxID=36596 RepID=A0A6J5V744_PRUAR|nr:unnamed protein product [Prunus armeniaca]
MFEFILKLAPAASLTGDKASFYHCTFISVQDTLHDGLGRHYFNDCFVEGAIDFIWGNGQSIYEKCKIISVTDRIGLAGFITAQGRNAANEPTGYVFNDCHVNRTGPIFLGRPYRNYSRAVFASTYMGNIITPEGWSEWLTGPLNLTTFLEVNFKGPGADMSRRVSWEKKLSNEEVAYLTNTTSFIDKEGWLEKQPK